MSGTNPSQFAPIQISSLPSATTPIQPGDLFMIAQNGIAKKVAYQSLNIVPSVPSTPGLVSTTGTLLESTTLAGSLSWSNGTLTSGYQAGTLTTFGTGLTLSGGTLSAPGGTGTVTSVVAGTGLSGGTITTTGTIALTQATTAALGGVIVGSGLGVASGTISNSGILSLVAGNSTTITSSNTIGVSAIASGMVSSDGTVLEATTLSAGGSWAAGTLTLNYQAGTLTTFGTGLTLSGGTLTAAGVPTSGLVSSSGITLESTTLAGSLSWYNGTLTAGYQAGTLTTFGAGLTLSGGTLTAAGGVTSLVSGANISLSPSTITTTGTISATGLLIASNNLSDVSSENLSRVNVNQGSVTLVTSGATISTNSALGNVFYVPLTTGVGPYTLATPTNLLNGATYIWRIVQPGSGSAQTIGTYGSAFKFPSPYSNSSPPALTSTLSATDILTGVSDGTNVYVAMANKFT